MISLLLLSLAPFSHEQVDLLLTIGDSEQALKQLASMPDTEEKKRQELLCYAKQGNIPKLLQAFSTYKDQTDPKLLEEVAWAILYKASQSNTPPVRQEAYIASFMANDARGIPLCLQALSDPSEQMRLVATTLAGRMRDEALLEATHQACRQDKSPHVRLNALQALGSMRYDAAKSTLEAILEEKSSSQEARMSALHALAAISKDPNIQALTSSDKMPLRLLACELMLRHGKKSEIEQIYPLINDPIFDVRLAAIECVAIFGGKPPKELMEAILEHQDIKTRILANWLCLSSDYCKARAIKNLHEFLQLEDRLLRLFTAGAISHSGASIAHFGDAFIQQKDPLVRLNLAIGCIWQRYDTSRAASFMLHALEGQPRLSWQSIGTISFVGPSHKVHQAGIDRLPETEDLMVRLELYSMIASSTKIPINEPLRAFLQDKTWGVSSQSAALMMQEGLLCLEELKPMLQDASKELSLQAAFLLALLAQDDEALLVLQKSYETAPRQMKEYILFAIGRVGNKSSLPFLVQVLKEPFETLRVSAARAILLTLYK